MSGAIDRLPRLAHDALGIVDVRAYQLRNAYGLVEENFATRRYRQAVIRAGRLLSAVHRHFDDDGLPRGGDI